MMDGRQSYCTSLHWSVSCFTHFATLLDLLLDFLVVPVLFSGDTGRNRAVGGNLQAPFDPRRIENSN
jgi:hypothetical protein